MDGIKVRPMARGLQGVTFLRMRDTNLSLRHNGTNKTISCPLLHQVTLRCIPLKHITYMCGRIANNQQRSAKYPALNPILADDTTLLRFDLKIKPSTAIMTSIYYSHRPMIVFENKAKKMRLLSKAFPWTIDIDSLSPITVEDVWEAMFGALQQPIMESEWGFVVRDGKKREEIEAAVKKRVTADPTSDKRPLRIDYLGETTLFRGLEKDDDFAKAMLLPPHKLWSETWIVKLIS